MKIVSALMLISYLLHQHQTCSAISDLIDAADTASIKSGMTKRMLLQKHRRQLQDSNLLAKTAKPLDDIRLFKVGYEHNCVVFTVGENKMRCWGSNSSGQLGLGDNLPRGDQLNEMGEKLPYVALGKTKDIWRLALGGFHTCVVFQDYNAKCFGDNRYGQLALGDTNNRGDQPNEMGDKLQFIDIGADKQVFNIVGGFLHTCMVVTENKVACFGYNKYGQLGGGETINRGISISDVGSNVFYADISLSNPEFIYTGPSANHTCVLDGLGAKCWGSNSKGQLGYGDTNNRGDEPHEMCSNLKRVPFLTGKGISDVAIGGANTCFINNRAAYCFGDNSYGQLALGHTNNIGDGPNEMGDNLKSMIVGTENGVSAATIGSNHICVYFSDLKFKCFGKNSFGELGQGDSVNRGGSIDTVGSKVPDVKVGDYGVLIYRLYAGDSHTCALFSTDLYSDTIKCFGNGSKGALGYGSANNTGDAPNEMGQNLQKVSLRASPKTKSPSAAPTFKPTKQPIRVPTKSPSKRPTRKPR